MASKAILKFKPSIREIRIHLCAKSSESQGLRNLVDEYYLKLKANNPGLPILIREAFGSTPRIWFRYNMGKELTAEVSNLKSDEIMKKLDELMDQK